MADMNVKSIVVNYIKELSEENGRSLSSVNDSQSIMDDLGLTSLQIATLISYLEADIGVDPFSDGATSITDIRTVGDICKLYEESALTEVQ